MSYAEMSAKISSTEFELWMALSQVRSEECPSCGRTPRELMDYTVEKMHCPVCKTDYPKVISTRR